MSNLNYLTSLVSSLAERLNQIEANAKRIFELPQQTPVSGTSKFPVSRPLEINEATEHITLNQILQFCIEELQNIEEATRVIQMLPPYAESGPRRIIIPVIDSELNQVDLIFSVNGVHFIKNTQQEINIPDAAENNYRKDLILGTETGDVIRFEGIENEEGIIDPIQPDNTVLLTYLVVYGSSTIEEPELPIIGSQYVKKTNWIDIASSGGDDTLTSVNEDLRHFVIKDYSGTGGVAGLSFWASINKPAYQGQEIIIDNDTELEIPLLHNFNDNNGAFTFPNEEDYLLKSKERVIFNIKGTKISFSSSNMASGGAGTLQEVLEGGNIATDKPIVFDSVSDPDDTVTIDHKGLVAFDSNASESVSLGSKVVRYAKGSFYSLLKWIAPTANREVFIQDKNHTLAGLDDVALSVETAGFAQRTGTAIAFDKWATYNSYSSPSDGNFSYDLTNAVVGMIQVSYHEDSLVPAFNQVGLTVMITGEYQPDVVNKIAFEYISLNRILINIRAL